MSTSTIDVLDTVLLNLRVEDGKFLADLGDKVVEIEYLLRDGDGNVWVEYWTEDGQKHRVLKYDNSKRISEREQKRVW